MSAVFRGTSEHPDCRPTARVLVDGVEVPTVNGQDGSPPSVEVQMRKTGVSDLTRVAEVHVPYEWYGDDVFGAVTSAVESDGIENSPFVGELEGFRRFGNGPVRIDVLDPVVDEYVSVFHGAINNVGPSTLDGAFRLMCIDWANYFENIAIDADFKSNAFETVIRTSVDTINEHDGIPDFDIGFLGDTDERLGNLSSLFRELVEEGASVGLEPNLGPLADVVAEFVPTPEKSFHKYKHSTADVLNWASETTGTNWYVDYAPTDDRPTIVVDTAVQGPTLQGQSLFEDSYESGDVGVITNNALFQLGPQYTLGGRGKKTSTRETSDELPVEVTGGGTVTTTVPEVVVQHGRLARIAGENPNPQYIESNASNLSTLENQVTKQLKERMDGAAGGEIITLPTPFARPYGTIEAQPACNGRLDRSVPEISYEIEEVVHRIVNPTVDTDDSNGPRTIVRCGIETTRDDFEVQSKRQIELD